MKAVNNIDKVLLRENGTDEESIKKNCKRYSKQLIQSNIINATFIKNRNPSKLEHICRKKDAQVEAFDMAMKKTKNVTAILYVAKVIRKEPIEHSRWKFSWSFQRFCINTLVGQASTMETYWSKRKHSLQFPWRFSRKCIQDSNANDLSKFQKLKTSKL